MTWSHSCQNLVVKTDWQKLSVFSRFIFLFELVHMCLQGENQQCFISYQHSKWNRLWKFQVRQIVLCQKFLTHWLNPVLSAEKKSGFIFWIWIWKQIWKISGKIIFWYNCDCTFSLAKYVSCQLSSGMHSNLTETSNKQTNKQNCSWHLTELCRSYLPRDKFPSLHNHALFTSLCGSTYTCEQLFSKLKDTKMKIRTKISDEHLENFNCLRDSKQWCLSFSIKMSNIPLVLCCSLYFIVKI